MSLFNKTIVDSIINAAGKEQAGVAALVAATDSCIQKAIDVLIVKAKTNKAEFMKGNARTNEARREVGELFSKLAPVAGWQESAVRNYQTSFWIAFKDGVPFQRDLYNGRNKEERGTKARNSGKVETTDYDALVKTIQKAIKQAALLENEALADDLLKVGKKHIDADWTTSE